MLWYTYTIIIYEVSKLTHSSILLAKRGLRQSHEIQLLTRSARAQLRLGKHHRSRDDKIYCFPRVQ